jgi:hypothetical protein
MGQAERKKGATWVQTLWYLSDLLAIGLAFLLGYWTRFHSPVVLVLPPEKGIPELRLYLLAGLITAAVWIPLLRAAGFYRLEPGRPRHRRGELIRTQALGMLWSPRSPSSIAIFSLASPFLDLALPVV